MILESLWNGQILTKQHHKYMNTETELVPVESVEPSSLNVIARAEIDSQISTAKQYPRQLSKVKGDMMNFATLDEETAQSCFYSVPRGGKNIQGPSVRLAEIAVSCYRNIRVGSRVIETVTKGENPHVVVQSVCHDLEMNVAVTVEKRRRIVGKKDWKNGGHKPIDEDDITLASNSGAAIAFRDAVFKVIPGALIKPVFEQAKKVAIGDVKTLGDRRAKSIEAFAKMGIEKARVLARLDKKSIEDVTLEDLETLLGLYNAIKEGHVTIEESFPAVDATPKAPVFNEPPITPEVVPARTPRKPKVADKAPEPIKEVAATPETKPDDPVERSFEEVVDGNPKLELLREAMAKAEVTEAQVLAFCASKKLIVEGKTGLESIVEAKLDKLTAQLPHLAGEMKKLGDA